MFSPDALLLTILCCRRSSRNTSCRQGFFRLSHRAAGVSPVNAAQFRQPGERQPQRIVLL